MTSSASSTYNCIAWAAEDTSAWWWPVPEVRGIYGRVVQIMCRPRTGAGEG